ncbi:MAG: sigma-70 family RNA polymerase sigma factor [Acidobacteria bacterium]|nr:sigma-70 family RNA polymerase sigma factor [Acidobacteriota bacterium]MCB9399075.1 sigma-70 family RNA polymerase sigma factor [Acidobacteriota bacterium]
METHEITDLLHAWQLDLNEGWHDLVPQIYDHLRVLAHRQARSESQFQTTELLHETLIKLEGQDRVKWMDRNHFYAVAATLMRRILIDQARQRTANRRGAGAEHLPLDPNESSQPLNDQTLIGLESALIDLKNVDPQLAKIVDLRVFAGFTLEETAQIMQCSTSRIKREWEIARIWLFDYMSS